MPHVDEDVLAVNDAFYRAFNDRDIGAMDRLWATGVPVTCIHPGWNALSGRDEVMESWRGILANPNQPRIVAGGASVLRRHELALVTCRELVAGNPLAATNAFVLEDGVWHIAHHHSSPVLNLPG